MISTFKDTTGGDKLLNSSRFLESERVKGAIIKVFTGPSCHLSATQGDLPRFMAVCSKFVSSSD